MGVKPGAQGKGKVQTKLTKPCSCGKEMIFARVAKKGMRFVCMDCMKVEAKK